VRAVSCCQWPLPHAPHAAEALLCEAHNEGNYPEGNCVLAFAAEVEMTAILPVFKPEADSLIRTSRQHIKESRETMFKIDALHRRLGLNPIGAPGNRYTTKALSKITGSGP
jgi:hypothetical protein